MRKLLYVLLSIIALWLSSCVVDNKLPADTPTSEGSEIRSTPVAVLTATETETPNPAVVFPTVTVTQVHVSAFPTPNIPPEARLEIKQLLLVDTFPSEYHEKGYIVIGKRVEHIPFVINLATSEKLQIVAKSPFLTQELGVLSPDEKWLIRLKNLDATEPENLVYELQSVEGEVQNVFTLPWGWMMRDFWVDDQQILADKKVKPEVLVYQTESIDPFTGQKDPLPFDYPSIYEGYTLMEYRFNVYDPTLHFVIYPAYLPDSPPGQVLRDVIKRKNIVSLPVTFTYEPVWSPDGTKFAIGGKTFIAEIFLNGKIVKLTNIEAYNGVGVDANFIQWSPDGRKIAFTMSASEHPSIEDNHCLAIIDVALETVTAYCVDGFNILGNLFSYRMIWSPDSQKILIQGDKPDPIHPVYAHSLLIDLKKQIAIDLGEGMDPLYFISSLPTVWVTK